MANKFKYRSTTLAFITLLLTGIPVQSSFAFDFHGYLRTGIGANSEGGDHVCFQLPGAKSKYRLGNECETYGDLRFSQRIQKKGQQAYYEVLAGMVFNVPGSQDWEQAEPSWRQAYVKAGNLFSSPTLKDATVWIGKRYIRRDVHITDFFYWDNSGPGAGIDDINLGDSKISYSFRRNTVTDDRAITSHDVRWYEIDSNQDGQLTLGINLLRSDESQQGFNGANGSQFHIEHVQQDFLGGNNKLVLQMGKGIGANLARDADDTLSPADKTTRVIDTITFNSEDKKWSGMFTVLLEDQKDTQQWKSMGVRPIYHFSENVNLAVELGYDEVSPEVGAVRKMQKITIAPQWSAGYGFFSRPVLRLFVTYAKWNDAAAQAAAVDDSIGINGVFSNERSGLTYGFHVEAWW